MFVALVLLTVLGSGTWLDVPFTSQTKDGCGSASIWMIIQYWNVRISSTVEEIHRTVFSPQAGGVYAADMERYFAGIGFTTYAFTGDWKVLQEHISQGRPLIVCLESNARGTPLHYVVVAGYEAEPDLLLINDPADRKLRSIHRGEFERRWKATGNWTLLAVPPKPTEPVAEPASMPPVTSTAPVTAESSPELELASSAFRRQEYSVAKRHAHRAAAVHPGSRIANDLLATLYYLDDNLEAAVKYWNRAGKPLVHDVLVDPPLTIDPVRLDRAFAFSRASLLAYNDLVLTKRRLDEMGTLSSYSFDLNPTDNDAFDLTLRASERSRVSFLSMLRGLPYESVHPALTNIAGRGVNLDGIVRWKRDRKRAALSVAGPAGASKSTRFRISADARNEQWADAAETRHIRKVEIATELRSPAGPRTDWGSGASLKTLEIDDVRGLAVKYFGSAWYDLVRRPERRLTIHGAARVQAGRWKKQRFGALESSLQLTWFPSARGSDFATTLQLRGGTVNRSAPFDELFQLGLDRDTELLLRAHHPFRVRSFVLLNSQVEKTLFDFGLLRLSLAPFLDTAHATRVLADAGVELRAAVASRFTLSVALGRDLRTGRTLGFVNSRR